MQLVHVVVGVADGIREAQVLRAEQLRQGAGDLDVQLAHAAEGALQALRDRALREAQPGELRDVLGHVAHALQRCADAQRRDDDAQVAGDRLLAGEDLDGLLVECDGELIDLGVVGDDLLGQRDVALGEGPGGLLDGHRDQIGDLGQP
ncbi:MAG: hypothetical protein BGN97_08715 [Microbacterium sp. 69-10]|nr:MAG: hypothetical protein BGN97_08715 [Microbacterium sp. 69-10]